MHLGDWRCPPRRFVSIVCPQDGWRKIPLSQATWLGVSRCRIAGVWPVCDNDLVLICSPAVTVSTMPLTQRFLNTNLGTVIILVAVLCATAFPVWIRLFRYGSAIPGSAKLPLRLTAAGQALFAFFVLGVAIDWFPLEWSHSFAAIAVLLCVAGAGIAGSRRRTEFFGPSCLISAVLTCVLWLLIVSMH